jgi:hypothetical protein
MSQQTIDWLLEGDSAIRWQVLKNILNDSEKNINKERALIFKAGWGKKLLSYQDYEGTWGKSLYCRKWISTTYTMLLLKSLGLKQDNKQARKACQILWEKGNNNDGGINFSFSFEYSETCVTGLVLSILSYFNFDKTKLEILVKHLLKQQMKDGGWNCRSFKGDTHSSFHTTINVLEGLSEFEKSYPGSSSKIEESRNKAIEFLLVHHLFKSHRTGEIFDSRMTRFSFPERWHYDIMRVLDFFQENDISKDERMTDSIEIIIKRKNKEGRWLLQQRHPGKTFFEMEKPGKSSRWNTLRAMRILNWWNK